MREHFYLQRIISLIIYSLLSFFVYYVGKNSKYRIKGVLSGYTLLLAVLAYFYKPSTSMDLYRLWITVDYYNHGRSVSQLLQIAFDSWRGSPLGLIYMGIICRIDNHLLPAITALIFYSNIFYIISDYAERKSIKSCVTATVVFFFMSRGLYLELISGIRCMLAFSIIARCIYNEIYKGRSLWIDLPIYAIVTLLHNSTLIIVVFRLAVYLLQEQKGIKRITGLVMISLIAVWYLTNYNSFVDAALTKVDSYFNTKTISYLPEYILQSLFIAIYMYFMFYIGKRCNLSHHSLSMRKLSGIVVLFCIVCFSVYTIYHRYLSFVSIIALPILMEVLDSEFDNGHAIHCKNMMALSVLILISSGVMGNLNNLRFFN